MAGIDLHDRHILLDTNVLIGISKYPDEFKSVLSSLSGAHVYYSSATKFEILRGATIRSEYSKLLDGINCFKCLEVDAKTMKRAAIYGCMINKSCGKGAELTDCINAALITGKMMDENEMWVLISADYRHYPLTIFDWIHFEAVNQKSDGDGMPYGFVEPNKEKFADRFRQWRKH
ncbi:MAG: hypothetical protein PHT12_03110 [Patescibacteria group bacterium]|nr:hypothetical protein [Patescibacteria group bacterium]